MPRVTRIDRSDAFQAIERVVARGEAPTHINVRAELGQRGSPPVISNFIGSWFACYGPSLHEKAGASAAQTGAPAANEGGAIAALTAAALEEIQRAAQQREQAHAQTIAIAQAEQAEATAALARQQSQFEQAQQVHQLHVERAYADRDQAIKEKELAIADAAGLRLALAVAKAELTAAQQQQYSIETLIEQLQSLPARLAD